MICSVTYWRQTWVMVEPELWMLTSWLVWLRLIYSPRFLTFAQAIFSSSLLLVTKYVISRSGTWLTDHHAFPDHSTYTLLHVRPSRSLPRRAGKIVSRYQKYRQGYPGSSGLPFHWATEVVSRIFVVLNLSTDLQRNAAPDAAFSVCLFSFPCIHRGTVWSFIFACSVFYETLRMFPSVRISPFSSSDLPPLIRFLGPVPTET